MSKLAEEIQQLLEISFQRRLESIWKGGFTSLNELKKSEIALIDEKLSGVLRLVAQMSLSGKAVDSLYASLKVD